MKKKIHPSQNRSDKAKEKRKGRYGSVIESVDEILESKRSLSEGKDPSDPRPPEGDKEKEYVDILEKGPHGDYPQRYTKDDLKRYNKKLMKKYPGGLLKSQQSTVQNYLSFKRQKEGEMNIRKQADLNRISYKKLDDAARADHLENIELRGRIDGYEIKVSDLEQKKKDAERRRSVPIAPAEPQKTSQPSSIWEINKLKGDLKVCQTGSKEMKSEYDRLRSEYDRRTLELTTDLDMVNRYSSDMYRLFKGVITAVPSGLAGLIATLGVFSILHLLGFSINFLGFSTSWAFQLLSEGRYMFLAVSSLSAALLAYSIKLKPYRSAPDRHSGKGRKIRSRREGDDRSSARKRENSHLLSVSVSVLGFISLVVVLYALNGLRLPIGSPVFRREFFAMLVPVVYTVIAAYLLMHVTHELDTTLVVSLFVASLLSVVYLIFLYSISSIVGWSWLGIRWDYLTGLSLLWNLLIAWAFFLPLTLIA